MPRPPKLVASAVAPRLALAGDEPPDPPRPGFLIVISGAGVGRKHDLFVGTLRIGRAEDGDVFLPEDSLSRWHASVIVDDDGVRIEDRGSTNGVWVNDAKVDAAPLQSGDVIKLGHTILKYVIGDDLESAYYDEIYRLSTVDGLTQIFNKRYLGETLQRELADARRTSSPLALLMLDIDHFRRCNDEIGHARSDELLRLLAQTVAARLQPPSLAARYGGEELVVLLPKTDRERAAQIAEDLRRTVETTDALEITISIGAAQLDASMPDGDALLQRAEAHMQDAKRSGRNRVSSGA